MRRFGAMGAISGELLSLHGNVLVHDSREELEFLLRGVRVVSLPDDLTTLGRPVMELRDHPQLRGIRFPLRREDFR